MFYVLAATFSTGYSYFWDVVRDWGIFKRKGNGKRLYVSLCYGYV